MPQIISLGWLVFLMIFFAGYFTRDLEIWPFTMIREIQDFVGGGSGETTTLFEKIQNDLGKKPTRFIFQYDNKQLAQGDYREIDGLELNERRQKPKVYISEKAPRGYWVIYGTFDFKDTLHGAIMLDQEANLVKTWHTSQEKSDWHFSKDENVYPQGFEMLSNGSIITEYNRGSSMVKYNYCGDLIWRIRGDFHHSITSDDGDTFWAWGDYGAKTAGGESSYKNSLLKINNRNGKLEKEISISEIMDANPDIDIFGVVQLDANGHSEWISEKYGGSWHGNDIEPLSAELAEYYPMFNEGDLLVSLRSPNLFFIVDPESLKVKWWSQGLTRRQHDPDWNDRGTITVFNNNMNRGYSSIVEIDPKTYDYEKLLDGERYNFYTVMKGTHQLLDNGGILISSDQQGRAFGVNDQGEIIFEFQNIYNGQENENLLVSRVIFIPEEFFNNLPECN